MKKTLLFISLVLLFNGTNIVAQTLNPTFNISTAGSANEFKGGYTFSYATSGTPWNGALISFGGLNNNYDCQISSDYGPTGGNHISYRTKNGDNNTWNSWNELATRGSNNFIGNQIISANLGIGIKDPKAGLDVLKSYDSNITKAIKIMYQGSWGTAQYASNYRFIDIYSTEEGNILSVNAYGMGIGFNPPTYNSPDRMYINGNVGIGTTLTGPHKLAVEGSIGAREIKVQATGWSDFVFKKEYILPTLEEVEKHITEKGHLENIPNEEEVLKNGINLGEMNAKLLQKIEELTLYIIDIKKNSIKQNDEIQSLKTLIISQKK
ncbi:hypothetical protein [Flavobacterium sp. C3NV]|uniref:hypothetical protein n=1 Tax=Flavobacterium sp. C3NV TaxID=3393358 RepID=UPI0039903539